MVSRNDMGWIAEWLGRHRGLKLASQLLAFRRHGAARAGPPPFRETDQWLLRP